MSVLPETTSQHILVDENRGTQPGLVSSEKCFLSLCSLGGWRGTFCSIVACSIVAKAAVVFLNCPRRCTFWSFRHYFFTNDKKHGWCFHNIPLLLLNCLLGKTIIQSTNIFGKGWPSSSNRPSLKTWICFM